MTQYLSPNTGEHTPS